MQPHLRATRSNAFLACLALAIAGATAQPAHAQSTPAQASSIETEMLTYRALESDSEAVACDIAGYLNGAVPVFTSAPAAAVCDVKSAAAKATVVVLPFDRTELADLQLWRVDMVTMAELRKRAAAVNCPAKAATSRSASTLEGALAATPAGPPLAMAQTVLALLASQESTSAVGGNIQDQAFMNGVARQLRSLRVAVVMPAVYTPFSLDALDDTKSPFLSSVDKLQDARTCLSAQLAKPDPATKDAATQTMDQIDSFLTTLGGSPAPSADSARPPTPADATKPAPAPTPAKAPAAPAPTPAAVTSHLLAVLSADGLAQKLGVTPATGRLPDNGSAIHLLLLKALESGGTVEKVSNILGTRIRYSGGAVGTYALFRVDGALECSGDVYDYAGSIPANHFQNQVGAAQPDPAKQVVFQRGSCTAAAGSQ
jgi:hypothetical protein